MTRQWGDREYASGIPVVRFADACKAHAPASKEGTHRCVLPRAHPTIHCCHCGLKWPLMTPKAPKS